MTHVATQTHEAGAHLKYPYWGLGPYHALASAVVGSFDGHAEFEDTIHAEDWSIRVNYSKSGFAPRDDDPIDGDRLYEWDVTCRGPRREKFSFNVSPRFPDQRHHETGDPVRLGWHKCGFEDTEGIDVEVQSSNVALDHYPSLLAAIFRSIMTHAGLDYNQQYFSRPPHAATSRILRLERYVRVRREPAQKLAGGDLMMRILRLLADQKGSTMELLVDNEDVVGKMHKAVLNPEAASELWTGHRLGKQLKHYHLNHPDSVDEDDPTRHPKFGVLVEKGKTHPHAIPWSQRDDLQAEIEEACINSLAWSDLPVKPDPTTFVADDHFTPGARDDAETVAIYDDPTPQIEADQEHLLVSTVRQEMTEADVDVLDALLTDGGDQHVDRVAANSGRATSTIYRALQRLDGIIESNNGRLSFTSRKFADEIRDIVQATEKQIESVASRVTNILGMDRRHSESSAMAMWRHKYGAEFEHADNGGLERIRIDTVLSELKYSSNPKVSDVIDEFVHAWDRSGRDVTALGDVTVEFTTDGRNYETALLASLRSTR